MLQLDRREFLCDSSSSVNFPSHGYLVPKRFVGLKRKSTVRKVASCECCSYLSSIRKTAPPKDWRQQQHLVQMGSSSSSSSSSAGGSSSSSGGGGSSSILRPGQLQVKPIIEFAEPTIKKPLARSIAFCWC